MPAQPVVYQNGGWACDIPTRDELDALNPGARFKTLRRLFKFCIGPPGGPMVAINAKHHDNIKNTLARERPEIVWQMLTDRTAFENCAQVAEAQEIALQDASSEDEEQCEEQTGVGRGGISPSRGSVVAASDIPAASSVGQGDFSSSRGLVAAASDIPVPTNEEVREDTQHSDPSRVDAGSASAFRSDEVDFSPPPSPMPIAEVDVEPAVVSSSGGIWQCGFDTS